MLEKSPDKNDQLPNIWKKEFRDVKRLFYTKRKESNLKFLRKVNPGLINHYKSIIKQHMKVYEDEISTYFKNNNKPLIGFDVEEYQNKLFCILGVKIEANKDPFIYLDVVFGNPSNKQDEIMQSHLANWLKTQDSGIVITHGTNENERKICQESSHDIANTQDIYQQCIEQNVCNFPGTSLYHFENFVGFERVACEFIKHKKELPKRKMRKFFDYFFQSCVVSLMDHLSKREQRKCLVCEKPHDVLLYCLEDAFSALLGYIYCINHGWRN